MDIKYSVKNFRTFDSNGAFFNISPITILTGCNSSGKSSMVKSLIVLNTYLKELRKNIDKKSFNPFKYPLNFYQKNVLLGKYDLVLNNKAQNGDSIEFSYEIIPSFGEKSAIVTLSFVNKHEDTMEQGLLQDLKISMDDTVVMHLLWNQANNDFIVDELNLNPFKEDFKNFIRYTSTKMYIDRKNTEEILGTESNLSEVEEAALEKLMHKNYDIILETFSPALKKRYSKLYRETAHNFLDKSTYDDIFFLLDENGLFNIPYLRKIQKLSKAEVIESLNSMKSGREDSEVLCYEIDKIVKDFDKSEETDFGKYFNEYEKRFLSFSRSRESDFTCGSFSFQSKDFWGRLRSHISYAHGILDEEFNSRIIATLDLDRLVYKKESDDCANELNPEKENWLKNRDKQNVSFEMLARVMIKCSNIEDDSYYPRLSDNFISGEVRIPSYNLFVKYVISVFEDILKSDILKDFSYLGSSKAEVKRLYSLEDTSNSFDALLVKYLSTCEQFSSKHFEPGSFINHWIKKFDIADKISFKNTADGLGLTVLVHVNEDDQKGHLLADEGYGITQLLATLINIEIGIMSTTIYAKDSYGNIVNDVEAEELKREYCSPYTIAIEEPEIHLHPKYQSMLADLFYDAYTRYNMQFIIETHSEYLVRRTQVLLAEMNLSEEELENKNPFRVYYFEKGQRPRDLVYQTSGRFVYKFGPGFFDAAASSALTLSKLERRK